MNKRLTRRMVGKMLLGATAAAALPALPPEAKPPARRLTRTLSPRERKDFTKSAAQLAKSAERVRKMKIPMGAEPAFVFAPKITKP